MRRVVARITDALRPYYDDAELPYIIKALLVEQLQIPESIFLLKEEYNLSQRQQALLDEAIQRLQQSEPLQYLLKMIPYCGLQFYVDSRVLIPRPETAELIEWIANDYNRAIGAETLPKSQFALLDVGTGSGAIAVVLAKLFPEIMVYGCDISLDALEVAKRNATWNGAKVTLFSMDILQQSEYSDDRVYNVIVSNPPYITLSEQASMHKRVLDYEPHIALFVPDNNPLLFYTSIAQYGLRHLKQGGLLYFEINPLFAPDVVSMLQSRGYSDVQVREDMQGKRRMVKALWHGGEENR